jgi:hypothetical protein
MNIKLRLEWEARILETLDRRPNKKCNYVLLRSEQVSNRHFTSSLSNYVKLSLLEQL